MPTTQFIGFVGPSYTLSSVNADCQRSVNLYPEVNELGTGKNHEVGRLVATPCLKLVTTAGTGPCRSFYRASNGRSFMVSGLEVYEVSGSTATLRGSVNSAYGEAAISDDGIELVVVSDGEGWVLTFADNTWAQITDLNFPDADTVDFLDQYMIVNDRNTGNFQISALADATSWDGLDLAAAEGSPDNLQTLLVANRELILFGDQTIENWFDSGDPTFPISRREGFFLERGIAGKGLKVKTDNGVFFWGKDKDGGTMAFRLGGSNAIRVSTHAIEQAVRKYGDISGGTCWTYQANGHTFWITNFPNADTTWVFDVATNLWHERQTNYGRHRAQFHVYDGSRHLVGDYENGNIYELVERSIFDPATCTDNGEPAPCIRTAPHISNQMKRVSHYQFLLDMETGVGTLSGNGSDPQAMLRFSDDGGHTWKRERFASIGKRGKYGHQVNWTRLGASRDRVYEVTIADPVPVTMISAFIDMQGLSS